MAMKWVSKLGSNEREPCRLPDFAVGISDDPVPAEFYLVMTEWTTMRARSLTEYFGNIDCGIEPATNYLEQARQNTGGE